MFIEICRKSISQNKKKFRAGTLIYVRVGYTLKKHHFTLKMLNSNSECSEDLYFKKLSCIISLQASSKFLTTGNLRKS